LRLSRINIAQGCAVCAERSAQKRTFHIPIPIIASQKSGENYIEIIKRKLVRRPDSISRGIAPAGGDAGPQICAAGYPRKILEIADLLHIMANQWRKISPSHCGN